MQSDNLKSYLHLHLIVFIWGFTAVLGKLISLQAIDLVWYRMAFALGFMLLYFFFSRESLKISIYTFFSLNDSHNLKEKATAPTKFGYGGFFALHFTPYTLHYFI
jgi:hypothetical protein